MADPAIDTEPKVETPEGKHTGGAKKGSMRSLTTLIVAITGVIGAVTALVRPADQSVTKASYQTLAEGIAEVDNRCTSQIVRIQYECNAQNESLRAYVDGFTRGQVPPPEPASVFPKPPRVVPTALPTPGAPAPSPPPASPSPSPPAAPQATSAAPVPTGTWKAPGFDAVEKRAHTAD